MLRTLTNTDDPIINGKGIPQAGVKIDFYPVDATDRVCGSFDTASGEVLLPTKISAETDDNGEFTVDLWITTDLDRAIYWLCLIPGVAPFKAVITAGDGPLTLLAFRASGTPATPAQLDALQLHIAETHLPLAAAAAEAIAAAEQTALDVIATAADRVQTGEDVLVTAADRQQTTADALATAADRQQTTAAAAEAIAAAEQTAQDVIATAADRVQTGQDAIATAADRTVVEEALARVDVLGDGLYRTYATKALATADLANIPADALIWINADTTPANNGYYAKTGGVLVQSSFDRVALVENRATALETWKTASAYTKNQFNIAAADVELGKYVSAVTGLTAANAGYNTTGFIPVVAGSTYTISTKKNVAWYNSSKVFISGSHEGIATKTLVAPAGAAFVRCDVTPINGTLWTNFQVELGAVQTAFEPYITFDRAAYRLSDAEENIEEMGNSVTAVESRATALESWKTATGYTKNQFNIAAADVELGKYVSAVTGLTLANASFNTTGFIPVVAGSTYTLSTKGNIAWYNSSKVFISGSHSGITTKTHTAPVGAEYLRCDVSPITGTLWTNFQVELGAVQTAFEPYITFDRASYRLSDLEKIGIPVASYNLANCTSLVGALGSLGLPWNGGSAVLVPVTAGQSYWISGRQGKSALGLIVCFHTTADGSGSLIGMDGSVVTAGFNQIDGKITVPAGVVSMRVNVIAYNTVAYPSGHDAFEDNRSTIMVHADSDGHPLPYVPAIASQGDINASRRIYTSIAEMQKYNMHVYLTKEGGAEDKIKAFFRSQNGADCMIVLRRWQEASKARDIFRLSEFAKVKKKGMDFRPKLNTAQIITDFYTVDKNLIMDGTFEYSFQETAAHPGDHDWIGHGDTIATAIRIKVDGVIVWQDSIADPNVWSVGGVDAFASEQMFAGNSFSVEQDVVLLRSYTVGAPEVGTVKIAGSTLIWNFCDGKMSLDNSITFTVDTDVAAFYLGMMAMADLTFSHGHFSDTPKRLDLASGFVHELFSGGTGKTGFKMYADFADVEGLFLTNQNGAEARLWLQNTAGIRKWYYALKNGVAFPVTVGTNLQCYSELKFNVR